MEMSGVGWRELLETSKELAAPPARVVAASKNKSRRSWMTPRPQNAARSQRRATPLWAEAERARRSDNPRTDGRAYPLETRGKRPVPAALPPPCVRACWVLGHGNFPRSEQDFTLVLSFGVRAAEFSAVGFLTAN